MGRLLRIWAFTGKDRSWEEIRGLGIKEGVDLGATLCWTLISWG